jgi:hypothetical protein
MPIAQMGFEAAAFQVAVIVLNLVIIGGGRWFLRAISRKLDEAVGRQVCELKHRPIDEDIGELEQRTQIQGRTLDDHEDRIQKLEGRRP